MIIENYSLGLDIGIGSVGWAVLDNDLKHITDFGVRIFESGENERDKDRESQKRRNYRGQRRNVRRRHHRKERLKHLLIKYDIITKSSLDKWYRNGNAVYEKICELNLCEKYTTRDFYPLRAMALDYKLTGEELAAVLIHICNHRGYNPFYDNEDDEKEGKLLQEYSNNLEAIMQRDDYRTVGEMYALAPEFKNPNEDFKNYGYIYNSNKKNSKTKKEEYYLALRSQIKKEAELILSKQLEFYPILNKEIEVVNQGNTERTSIYKRILDIIFSQRDFEDGPSYDENNSYQKYHGFTKDSVGHCMYYPNEKRGIRASLLGDLFATTNLLSQYTYFDKDTGVIGIVPDAAKELVNQFIEDGELTSKTMKNILNKYNLAVNTKTSSKDTFSKCNKFTKEIKNLCDNTGISWKEITQGMQLSTKTPLYKLADTLAFNITPKRKKAALKKLNFLNDDFIDLIGKNYGGTASVSDKFMIESIEAFMDGEIYGDFQARKLNERFNNIDTKQRPIKMPIIKDIDMIKNPVVFRSLNETRKVVNAIIEKYGSPSSINVEVASDLNRSFEARTKLSKMIRQNEKNNDEYRRIIADITGQSINSVTPKEIDRYKLYEQQEGKCLYSGETIDNVADIFTEKYEVDHIIPFSLILDNTLNNKCLVLRRENQMKKQRTPLQYFREEDMPEKEAGFQARVNTIFKFQKNESMKVKYQYLMTPDIYDETLFEQWKSRNINDTRYIAKYAVNMLSGIEIKNKGSVIPIKGGITSKFRSWWLLRRNSQLEPYQYIEKFLLEHKRTLSETENETEKQSLLKSCIDDMEKHYGFDAEYSKKLLENNLLEKNRETSNLHHAVDAIILAALSRKYIELALDNNKLYEIWREHKVVKEKYYEYIQRYKNNKNIAIPQYSEYLETCKKKMNKYYYMSEYQTEKYLLNPNKIPCKFDNLKDEVLVRTIDNNQELFYNLTHELYESKFADSLQMPIVSAKPERKFTGAITSDNAVKKTEQSYKTSIKTISEKNHSVLPSNKYYCIEVYKNNKDETRTRAIKMIDVIKRNGKLYLRCDNPEDYKKHVMYLFKNDYIQIINKGKITFEGFYTSVKNINRSSFYCKEINSPKAMPKTIAKKDIIKKYNVDILGKKGGEIKCGEPLLSIMPKR